MERTSRSYAWLGRSRDEKDNSALAMDMMAQRRADAGHQFHGLRTTRTSKKQILLKALYKWIVTAAVVASIYAVLFYFESLPAMSRTKKHVFNGVITGLSIALGLAVASALNGMVADLRWWALSRQYLSRQKVDLILDASDLKHTIKLALHSRRTWIHAAAVLWVLLNIGSQVALAAIGLCYSTDTAEDVALFRPGDVSIAKLSGISTEKVVSSKSTSVLAQQYTANKYGTVSFSYSTAGLDAIPESGQIWGPAKNLTFCGPKFCQYVFHETAAEPPNVVVTTSRSIKAWAACNSWPVISGGNGTEPNITVAYDDDNDDLIDGDTVVPIPVQGGVDQRTYMTNTSEGCGVGCSAVQAFEASATAPWYYSCNIIVDPVTNATCREHEAGDSLRVMASAAIALQGYDVSSVFDSTDYQFSTYPAESYVGQPLNGSTEAMEQIMARYAIGVIAVADQNNGMIVVDGMVPFVGSVLDVTHWIIIHFILIFTLVLQLAFGLIVAMITNRVIIPPEDATALAQVLKTIRTTDQHEAENGGSYGRSVSHWIYRAVPVGAEGVYDFYMEKENIFVAAGEK